jgi:hypothetical protein
MKDLASDIMDNRRLDLLIHVIHIYDSRILQEITISSSQNIKHYTELTHCIDLYAEARTSILCGMTIGEYENIYQDIMSSKTTLAERFKEKVEKRIEIITKATEEIPPSSNDNNKTVDMLYMYQVVAKVAEPSPDLSHITNDTIYSRLSHYAMSLIEDVISEPVQENKINLVISGINNLVKTLMPYICDKVGECSIPDDKDRVIKSIDAAIDRLIKILAENTFSDTFGNVLRQLPKSQHERFITMYILKILVNNTKEFIKNKDIDICKVYDTCEVIALKYIDVNVWNIIKKPTYMIIQILDSEIEDIQQIFETMVYGSPESYQHIKQIVQIITNRRKLKLKLSDIEVHYIDGLQKKYDDWKQRFVENILAEIYDSLS